MERAKILSLGTYYPEKILSNKDLEEIVDTTDEWIFTRTGIKERRIAAPDETASDMGLKAAQQAMDNVGWDPKELDMILVATMTGDYLCPSTANLIQSRIGATNAAAVDMAAACSGFLYTLSVAKAYVESGMYQKILIVTSEKMSTVVDYTDRKTCILFGDGAAAATVGAEGKGLKIGSICLGSDGSQGELLYVPAGGSKNPTSEQTVKDKMHYLKMEGREVFKHAVRRMEAAANKCLEQMGMEKKDLNWLVPHQANLRIIDAIARRFDFDSNQIHLTIHRFGNTSAVTIPTTLKDLLDTKGAQVGENILLVAFGGGLTWGAALLTQE